MYLYKVSLITAIFYILYKTLFCRTSFHLLNRLLLIFILLFSLICPLLEISNSAHYQFTNFGLWIEDFQEYLTYDSVAPLADSGRTFNILTFLLGLYIAGVLVFLIRFLNQFRKIIRIKNHSDGIRKGKFTFLLNKGIVLPFSFFHWIFLPSGSDINNENDAIILHEKIHGYQWHSLDLIFVEIFTIAFWFNPFVFLLKRSLKATHEYLADEKVVEKSVSLPEYLNILVSGTENACFSRITNQFNYLIIKNRIEMIAKNKTQKIRRLRYFILLPALALVIYAFSNNPKNKNSVPSNMPIEKTEVIRYSVTHGAKMTDPFTNKERIHNGIDMVAKEGTKIVSASEGLIAFAGFSEKGWGNLIIIRHDENYETLYAHLKDILVKPGDYVQAGQVIATVGSTGKSTGPHLHYEVRENGESVDPLLFFK